MVGRLGQPASGAKGGVHHARRKRGAICEMESQLFEIPTRDGRTRLTGQVDLPAGEDVARRPTVMIVPGGWFMDRDGYMGNSGTERDLIYRDLAREAVAAGIVVVRYDNRGVRCNEMTMPPCSSPTSELEATRHYLSACVDPDVRQTVTVRTQMDDVEDLWVFATHHPAIDPTRVVILAHSEGGLNVARSIGASRIDPRGIVFVGTATESPAASFRFSTVDRYAERVMDWDADGDGRVTAEDVEREFPADALFAAVGVAREVVTPPEGEWTPGTIRARFEKSYDEMKAAAFAKLDSTPYPDQWGEFRMVAASNNWWRQWFEDSMPVIDHLAGYDGHASFHFGEIDSQCPGGRQLAFAENRIRARIFARAPRLVFHEGRGHSLRTGEPVAGPMDLEAKARLLEEIEELHSSA